MHHEPTTLKSGFLGIVLGVIAVVALACGGGDDEPAPTATSVTGSIAGTATPATRITPSTIATSSSSNTPARASLASLNSYKYTIKMSGKGGPLGEITGGLDDLLGAAGNGASPAFEVTGSYIKPDRAQTTIKFGAIETRSVIVGTQQWTTFGGQTIGPSPATAADIQDANFLSTFWTDDGFGASIKDFKCGSRENVNGVSATKCTLDKAGFEKLSRENPDFMEGLDIAILSTANVEAWIAEGGFPVRMRMDVAGKDSLNADFNFKVELDVTDINGNFQITAPRS